MPISDAFNKTDRLQQLQLLFWKHPGRRLKTSEIASILSISHDTASRYLESLSVDGRLPLIKDGWYWQLAQDAQFELLPVKLNLPEGTVLYLAARLLSQIYDERNIHVLSALNKLVSAMPDTIAPYQHEIIDLAQKRQEGQRDLSAIFETLALGWATRRVVRLTYTPPGKRMFECHFAPYLLEPSGIGRTIYALGHSAPPDGLRTFKIERIDRATLTEDSFEIPENFDGPTLLTRAWGVMYGDEMLVEVHLRFSHRVTQRVHETLWHPSQQIVDTTEGCEWIATIGDTVEIENWIRGWGADCEVLAPQSLRDSMVQEARRLAHLYGVQVKPATLPDEPDNDLLSNIFGG